MVQDPEGDGKIVYLFLPLYKVYPFFFIRGHSNSMLQKGNLQDAINHHFAAKTHFTERELLRYFKGTCEAVQAMHDYRPSAKPSQASGSAPAPSDGEVLHEHGETEDDGASVPLVVKQHAENGEPIFGGDDDEESEDEDNGKVDVVPYAHRDLKPAFVRSFV